MGRASSSKRGAGAAPAKRDIAAPAAAPQPAASPPEAPKTPDYRHLTAAAKQARVEAASREPAIACPRCGTMTTVADGRRHLAETCTGRREAHPLSKWVSWRQAVEMGVPKQTLHDWVQRGVVQIRTGAEGRQYLERDVVWLLMLRGPVSRTRGGRGR